MQGAFTWTEIYTLPIAYRQFYVHQMMEYMEKEKEEQNKVKNSPNKRNFHGVPSKPMMQKPNIPNIRRK